MCYSAKIRADYRWYVRTFGAIISIADFVHLYWERGQGSKAKIPKAMDAAFSDPKTDDEHKIKAMIDAYDTDQTSKLEQEVFKQRKRLADAERTLQTKTTKPATESKRRSQYMYVFSLALGVSNHRNFDGVDWVADMARGGG